MGLFCKASSALSCGLAGSMRRSSWADRHDENPCSSSLGCGAAPSGRSTLFRWAAPHALPRARPLRPIACLRVAEPTGRRSRLAPLDATILACIGVLAARPAFGGRIRFSGKKEQRKQIATFRSAPTRGVAGDLSGDLSSHSHGVRREALAWVVYRYSARLGCPPWVAALSGKLAHGGRRTLRTIRTGLAWGASRGAAQGKVNERSRGRSHIQSLS